MKRFEECAQILCGTLKWAGLHVLVRTARIYLLRLTTCKIQNKWQNIKHKAITVGCCASSFCVLLSIQTEEKRKKKNKQGRPGNKAVVDSDKLLYGVIVSTGVLGTRYTEPCTQGY